MGEDITWMSREHANSLKSERGRRELCLAYVRIDFRYNSVKENMILFLPTLAVTASYFSKTIRC